MLNGSSNTAKIPALIGHRGVPSLAPENTLGGIRKAASLGVRWVELDVTLLADGTPVINHDADIDRLSDRSGVLSELYPEDLVGVDNAAHFAGWPEPEPVPTLQATLALLDELDMGLNLEIKEHGLDPRQVVRQLAPLLNDFDAERLIVSSFSEELLRQCQLQLPKIKRGLLTDRLVENWRERAQVLALFSLHCHWRCLDAALIALIQRQGYRVLCWTVNDRDAGQRLLEQGVDALITDSPQQFAPVGDRELTMAITVQAREENLIDEVE